MPSHFLLCTFLTSESISACSEWSEHGGSVVPSDRTKMVVMRLHARLLAYFTVSFCCHFSLLFISSHLVHTRQLK